MLSPLPSKPDHKSQSPHAVHVLSAATANARMNRLYLIGRASLQDEAQTETKNICLQEKAFFEGKKRHVAGHPCQCLLGHLTLDWQFLVQKLLVSQNQIEKQPLASASDDTLRHSDRSPSRPSCRNLGIAWFRAKSAAVQFLEFRRSSLAPAAIRAAAASN